MSDLTNGQLLEIIDDTLAWASDVSEKWAGTLHAGIIDETRAKLIKAVEQHDLEHAHELVHDLATVVAYAEKAYEAEHEH